MSENTNGTGDYAAALVAVRFIEFHRDGAAPQRTDLRDALRQVSALAAEIAEIIAQFRDEPHDRHALAVSAMFGAAAGCPEFALDELDKLYFPEAVADLEYEAIIATKH